MSPLATPISGTTAECVADFAKRYPTDVVVNELTEFVGSAKPAALDYLSGKMPTGKRLVKLRTLLVALGYKVEEFYSMAEDNQDLCLMIGYRLLTPEEVKHRLSYKDMGEVLSITLRGQRVVSSRANEFDRLLRGNRQQLGQAQTEFQARIEVVLGGRANNGGLPLPEPAPPRHPHIIPNDDQRIVIALAHNLGTVGQLAGVVADQGEKGKDLLSAILTHQEVRRIVSQIERLLPE